MCLFDGVCVCVCLSVIVYVGACDTHCVFLSLFFCVCLYPFV